MKLLFSALLYSQNPAKMLKTENVFVNDAAAIHQTINQEGVFGRSAERCQIAWQNVYPVLMPHSVVFFKPL